MHVLTVASAVVRGILVFGGVVRGGDVLIPQLFDGIDVQHDVVGVARALALGLQLAEQTHTHARLSGIYHYFL